jgi:predicted RNase H-like HicB family nuclease
MITEGDTAEEALENVRDALAATIEIYEDLGKPFPAERRGMAAPDCQGRHCRGGPVGQPGIP